MLAMLAMLAMTALLAMLAREQTISILTVFWLYCPLLSPFIVQSFWTPDPNPNTNEAIGVTLQSLLRYQP